MKRSLHRCTTEYKFERLAKDVERGLKNFQRRSKTRANFPTLRRSEVETPRGVFLTLFRRVAGTLRGFFRKLLLPVALMRDQSGHQGGQDMTSLRSVPSRDLACMPK